MRVIIVMSMLIGWLVAELKEFFTNGGFSNTLAFNLLRILIIACLIVFFVAMMIMANILNISNDIQNNFQPEFPLPPNNQITHSAERKENQFIATPEKKYKVTRVPFLNNSVSKKIS